METTNCFLICGKLHEINDNLTPSNLCLSNFFYFKIKNNTTFVNSLDIQRYYHYKVISPHY